MAKKSVAALLDPFGYDTAAPPGATAQSWRVQEGNPAYVLPYLADPQGPWPWTRESRPASRKSVLPWTGRRRGGERKRIRRMTGAGADIGDPTQTATFR